MKNLLIAGSALLLLTGCATCPAPSVLPHRVMAPAVKHEAAIEPVPVTPIATPVPAPAPKRGWKWLH